MRPKLTPELRLIQLCIAKKLEQNGMFTMGDVALCSERNEDLLYKLFGKNAELLLSLIHI